MKRILIIFISLMIISPTVVSARKHPHRRPGHEKQEKRHHRPMCYISDNGVFFDGHKIKGASAFTFKILSDGYAADAWSVYYLGVKIKGASPDSFKALDGGYAKDTWSVYYDGAKIKGASPDSFICGHDGYARDNWHTYYRGRKID